MTHNVIGYTYSADNYCPQCLVRFIRPNLDESVDLPVGVIEHDLDLLARDAGINRQIESSFDSGDFPKVILNDYKIAFECGGCGVITQICDAESIYGHGCGLMAPHEDEHLCLLVEDGEPCEQEWTDEDRETP